MDTLTPPAPRHSPRIPSRVERLPDEGGRPRFLGYLGNISDSGAFLQCSRPRDEGTSLAMRLHLGRAEGETLDVDAQVVWIRGYGGLYQPAAGMGLTFYNIDVKALKRIRAFSQKRG